jgi:hypothetical protein
MQATPLSISTSRRTSTAQSILKNDAEPAVEGQTGDFNTLKTAMYLKDLGVSPERAVELLNEHYNPSCEPPWDLDDLVKKVTNATARAVSLCAGHAQ